MSCRLQDSVTSVLPNQTQNPRTAAAATAHLTKLASDSCALRKPSSDLMYAQYVEQPKEGAKIGTLTLDELKIFMPLIEGTSTSSLRNGAGHYVDSVLPGVRDNSVISGHRETVFKDLGKLEIGHHVNVITTAGSFTYRVSSIRVVDANDRTVIVPTSEATLTLTTCYPFKAYGPKPERYIVSAQLINSTLESSF